MARKIFTGIVVSNKMKNTVLVKMEREVPHPRYGKLIKKTGKLMADTNGVEFAIGDVVVIEEIKPMSKNKNFKVVRKTKEEAK